MLLIQCILSCGTRQRLMFTFSSSLHQQYFSFIFDIRKGFEEKYFKSYVFGLLQNFLKQAFLSYYIFISYNATQFLMIISFAQNFLFTCWNILFQICFDQFPSLIINAIWKENIEIMRTWILNSKLYSVEMKQVFVSFRWKIVSDFYFETPCNHHASLLHCFCSISSWIQ